MKNGVSSDVYEGEIKEKNVKRMGISKKKPRGKKGERKKWREEKKGKMRKKKRRRDSLDPGGS